MKRRVAIIVVTTGLFTIAGTAAAHADDATSLGADSSGCVVLLPDADNPITVCLFPR